MNRDALRATAHNGCIQPVRGSYGAIRIALRRRRYPAVRPWSLLVVLLLIGAGVAAYFFLAGALSPQPALRIISPTTDVAISGGKTTIAVEVRNAELGAAARGKSFHLHYYLDATIPTAHDRPAIPAIGAWASSAKTTHEWSISGAGLHILAVQLVTADDRPLNPPVVAAVVVQVPKPPSAPAPSSTPAKTSPAKAKGGC
jgi:hypothetical protein